MLSPDRHINFTEEELWYGTSGPRDARIVIVGEAWGFEEASAKRPFVGASGSELTRILANAGIARADVLLTNLVAGRPPNNELWRFFDGDTKVRGQYPSQHVMSELQRLHSQIVQFPRSLVVAAGNYALWALSSLCGSNPVPHSEGARQPSGIMSWRGSMIETETIDGYKFPLLPIIHPAAVLRDWALRYITVHDLRARVPMALVGDWNNPNPPVLLAPPSFRECIDQLDQWLRILHTGRLRCSCDIETHRGLITCLGIATSSQFAMTIPFVRKVDTPTHTLDSWWTPTEEAEIVSRLIRLLKHPNVNLEGQKLHLRHSIYRPLVGSDALCIV